MNYEHLLKQTAVYWAKPTFDGYNVPTFDNPVEVKVRWESKTELFLTTEGKEVYSKAVVVLNRDVELDGYLYLGTLAGLSVSEKADPRTISTGYVIRQFRKTPSLDGLTYLRKAYL